ncbi:MAG: zf-HC2 domain-containing protein [Gemmatimonadota bacterium]
MTCLELFDYLDRYHAGTLDRLEAEAVEQHLLSCAECAADFRFQRTLRTRTAALTGTITPAHDLWGGIREQIREVPSVTRSNRPRWQRAPWLIAAGVVLVALSSGVTALLTRTGSLQPAFGSSDFHSTEVGYRQAAEELVRTLQAHRKDLGEPAFRVIEQNLRVIDQAIEETQAALASDPRNQQVTALLWASYEKKIDLLQRAAHNVES